MAGLAALVLAAAPGSAHAQLYKTAPPALNARAERQLRGLFAERSESAALKLFAGDVVICGPFLWRKLEGSQGLEKQGVKSRFFTDVGAPGQVSLTGGATGRTFNTKQGVAAFRRAFLAAFPADARVRIRKLPLNELRLYAALWPVPPEEPLFVVETGRHKLVVTMNDQLQIFAIDDYLHLP